MTDDNERRKRGHGRDRVGGGPADGWDRAAADASDEPIQDALVEESDRLMNAVNEIKQLESEKRRLSMSTPEFHRAAARIERIARQIFGIAKAQREVGEALQSQHDESIEDEAKALKRGEDRSQAPAAKQRS